MAGLGRDGPGWVVLCRSRGGRAGEARGTESAARSSRLQQTAEGRSAATESTLNVTININNTVNSSINSMIVLMLSTEWEFSLYVYFLSLPSPPHPPPPTPF